MLEKWMEPRAAVPMTIRYRQGDTKRRLHVVTEISSHYTQSTVKSLNYRGSNQNLQNHCTGAKTDMGKDKDLIHYLHKSFNSYLPRCTIYRVDDTCSAIIRTVSVPQFKFTHVKFSIDPHFKVTKLFTRRIEDVLQAYRWYLRQWNHQNWCQSRN